MDVTAKPAKSPKVKLEDTAKNQPIDRRSLRQAKSVKLPLVEDQQGEDLIKAFILLGAKVQTMNVRANDFKDGEEPFAIKITVSGFTFLQAKD